MNADERYEFDRALERAEVASAAAQGLTGVVDSPVDRAFLGHLMAAHGVDRASVLDRDPEVWHDFHRLMPHDDHSHGWDAPTPPSSVDEGNPDR